MNTTWIAGQGYQYEIWTDDNKTLALHYGAISSQVAFFPDRITKILDASGDLILEYDAVNVDAHPSQVLADCELLFAP